MRVFALLYFLSLGVLYVFAAPILLLLAFKQKYKESIPKRFFLKNNPKPDSGDVWIHACSYGEVKSLKPLLKELENKKILITAITQTGYKEALALGYEARYLPFEIFLPWWAPRYKTLVVTEAELWFGLFYTLKNRGTKIVLINSRISDRSYKGYRRFRWLYKRIFALTDVIFAQQEKDKERLESLGAKNIRVSGNIKLLHTPKITKHLEKPESLVLTAASTHEGEEMLILDAFLGLGEGKLIIVPRHPERFLEVRKIIEEKIADTTLSFGLFSNVGHFNSDITLVDAMGELINIYAISDIVVLGGAFAKVGGHNPIEPAYFGCRIISGLNIFNQFALFEKVENYILCDANELKNTIKRAADSPPSFIKGSLDINEITKEIL